MGDGKQGDRKFYDLPKIERPEPRASADPERLGRYINANIIGRDVTFDGPFGRRQVVYCDYIASGKSLKAFIQKKTF
jgi:hypothetical protein